MMNDEQLKILCDLTFELTELKLSKVEHLCIENFASKTLYKLIAAVAKDEEALMRSM